jgi:hypothetical protein
MSARISQFFALHLPYPVAINPLAFGGHVNFLSFLLPAFSLLVKPSSAHPSLTEREKRLLAIVTQLSDFLRSVVRSPYLPLSATCSSSYFQYVPKRK